MRNRYEYSKHISPAKIVKQVSDIYKVRIRDILGDGRPYEITRARWAISRFLRDEFRMPYRPIAEILKKTPNTVCCLIRNDYKYRDNDYTKLLGSLDRLYLLMEEVDSERDK